jgi:hypothetical protein
MAVMNPGGRKSASGTPFSVSDTVRLETDQLLQLAAEEGFGQRKQAALKTLVRCRVVEKPGAHSGVVFET